jgi:ABC-type antimicrobial peptide transport system permease subunit
MILKDLTFAFRNIRRNILVSCVNVLGLSIGLSSCLIIGLIVNYEMSFDRFQPDRDRIFRVYTTDALSGLSNPGVPTAFAAGTRDYLTGVESVVNFYTFGGTVKVANSHGEPKELGVNNKIIITPPDYFDVFDYYQWVVGNPKMLERPFQVVLTESRARMYFGDVSPLSVVGKEVYYSDSLAVTVAGIIKDVEENTDLDFTDFISASTIEHSWLNRVIGPNSGTLISSGSQLFLKLSPGTSHDDIERQFPLLREMHNAQYKESRLDMIPMMQSLRDMHFNADLGIFDTSRSVIELSTLKMLLGVAVLLLFIAVINFVNLETAQSFRYGKEVGVRKVLGSSRGKLIRRFLMQSFVLCAVAGMVSAGLADLYFRYLGFFTPEGFVFRFSDPVVALFLVSGVIVVALMAGVYPAFVLSSFQPARALKGAGYFSVAMGGSTLARRGLTVFQFSFSQILIVTTVVMISQLNYMLEKDLGFHPEAVVLVTAPTFKADRLEAFKNELLQHPEIRSVTLCDGPPMRLSSSGMDLTLRRAGEPLQHRVEPLHGDTSYLNVFGLRLIAGRNVVPYDSAHEFLVNQAFLDAFGFEEPSEAVGKMVDKGTIVGVVEDFHTKPLWNGIKPTVIFYRTGRSVGIKLSAANGRDVDVRQVQEKIAMSYRKIFPDSEFGYQFLDEQLRRIYASEQRIAQVAGMSTSIAILISCLGLFGYFSYTVSQRTKEIGIRKVLGATIVSILALLSMDFLKIVLVALIISVPTAFYIVHLWLEKFVYKVDVTAWVFLVSAAASVVMCIITIGVRSFYAAKENPVRAMRYE